MPSITIDATVFGRVTSSGVKSTPAQPDLGNIISSEDHHVFFQYDLTSLPVDIVSFDSAVLNISGDSSSGDGPSVPLIANKRKLSNDASSASGAALLTDITSGYDYGSITVVTQNVTPFANTFSLTGQFLTDLLSAYGSSGYFGLGLERTSGGVITISPACILYAIPGNLKLDLTYTLGITIAPEIIENPESQTKEVNDSASFTLIATGTGLAYQWRFNGVNIFNGSDYQGTSSSVLSIDSVQLDLEGYYDCVITNSQGLLVSNRAYLIINKHLFAPQLTSPIGKESFNFGSIIISWNSPTTISDDSEIVKDMVFNEIQYTDNYLDDFTAWVTITSRISSNLNSYIWKVGKQIKSSRVRIRIRSIDLFKNYASEWSTSSFDFSVNVFKLTAPAIVNPIGKKAYSNFIQIILDETLVVQTYNQKILYTLEYSSEKESIDWTVISKNLPIGSTLIRWDISSLPSSDDYVLKLTAKGISNYRSDPDQFAIEYIYDIKIQQSGTFIIDTVPPETILKIKNSQGITNQTEQIITIYADDQTTEVEEVQLHECDAIGNISLGQQPIATDTTDQCFSLDQLIGDNGPLPDISIGKPTAYTISKYWNFKDKSGLRKLEALVKDTGGNSSLQSPTKVFLELFDSSIKINDFLISKETISKTVPVQPTQAGDPLTFQTVTYVAELLYLTTNDGSFYVLEPFSRFIYTIPNNEVAVKLGLYNGSIYLFTYNILENNDSASVYRNESDRASFVYGFPNNSGSKTNAICVYKNKMYIGLNNGKLYQFNGSSFSVVYTFSGTITTLSSDDSFLYIGFSNSSDIYTYDGSTFTSVSF